MYRRCDAFVRLVGAVVWACAACLTAVGQGRAPLPRGPYLQMAGAESVVIVWRTEGAIRPIVRYGANPARLDRTMAPDAISVRTEFSKSPLGDDQLPQGAHQYEARLTGLSPLTTYYYAVLDGHRLLAGGESFRFRTYPRPGEAAPLRFAAFGDSHGQGWLDAGVDRDIAAFVEREGRPIDLYLQCGDMTSKGRHEEYQYLFDPSSPTRRSTVLWPTPGNHDMFRLDGAQAVGPYADLFVVPTQGELGGAPSGTEAYYSFDYGRVHFVSLASFVVDRGPHAPMAQWLRADLKKAREEGRTDWLIAFFHSPPFSDVASDRNRDSLEMRAWIMPILEEGGVDVIFHGHFHCYERTFLIDGAYDTPLTGRNVVLDDGDGDPNGDGAYRKSAGLNPHEGVVSVITYGGRGAVGHEGPHPVSHKNILAGGMTIVDIDGDTLTARRVTTDGEVQDAFSIVKRGKVQPHRLAAPRRTAPELWCRLRLPGLRYAHVPPVEGAITLDGVMDEPAWQKAHFFKEGVIFGAWLLHQPDALYVAVDFWTGRAHPKARMTTRDGTLGLDPSVELLIAPDRHRKAVYMFGVNCDGVQRDEKDGDPAYDADWQAKTLSGVGIKNECWRVEMRIPWAAMERDGPPAPEAFAGMNLLANNGGTGVEWFPGHGDRRYIGAQVPEQFGWVRFAPGRVEALVPLDADWRYLAGAEPAEGWAGKDFDDRGWKTSKAGFGYGDIENTTPLLDMKGRYGRVYIRHRFEVKAGQAPADLGLMVNYDDAFIAYLDGQEVLRVGVGEGRGASAKGVAVHEGTGPEYAPDVRMDRYTPLEGRPLNPSYFSLKAHTAQLGPGEHVLALEGHNAALDSKAFTLDPWLIGVFGE